MFMQPGPHPIAVKAMRAALGVSGPPCQAKRKKKKNVSGWLGVDKDLPTPAAAGKGLVVFG